MIGHLRGKLLSKKPYQVLLEVNGVGYEVRVPYSTSQLPALREELALHVHTHVREDAIALYGFKTEAEREMFLQLLTVKNIGPRIALTALAGLTPQDISQAVRHSNPMALVIPGIGPKTAERIVQELRGVLAPAAEAERAGPPLHGAAEEAVSALENMGCEPKRALEAVQAVLQSSEELAPSSSRAKKPALLVPSGIEGSGVEGSRDQIQSFEALMKGALQWLREKRR